MAKNMKLKLLVKKMYQVQNSRIRLSNQIRSQLYVNELPRDEFGNPIMKKDEDEKLKVKRDAKMAAMFAFYDENKLEMDKISRYSTKVKYLNSKKGAVTDILQWSLIDCYMNAVDEETKLVKVIKSYVHTLPLWDVFFKNVKGCGEGIAAVIMSEVDIDKCRHCSSLRKYAGLDVVDGHARSKRKEDLVTIKYKDSDGNIKEKLSITYNEFLRTKLLGVLGPSFIKHGGEYRKVYDNYKNRYTLQHPDYTKLRIHRMALRKSVVIFLKDLWNVWRDLEGYAKEPDYWEAYISGRAHGESLPKINKNEKILHEHEPESLF